MHKPNNKFRDSEIRFDISSIEPEFNPNKMEQALEPVSIFEDKYRGTIYHVNRLRKVNIAEFIQTARLVRGLCDLLFEESFVSVRAECPDFLALPFIRPQPFPVDAPPPYPPFINLREINGDDIKNIYNGRGGLRVSFSPINDETFPFGFASLEGHGSLNHISIYAQGLSENGVSVANTINILAPKRIPRIKETLQTDSTL